MSESKQDVPKFERLESHGEKRVCLRRLVASDLKALVAYRSDPDVARYQSWSDYDEKRGQQLIDEMVDRQPGMSGWFQFAVALRSTGELVGDCALRIDADDARLGEIGFTLAKSQQGKGIGAETVRLLLRYAFGTLRLHRVCAVTDAANIAAASLLARVGLRKEAHFVKHTWFKGAWGDEFVFAMLGSEWVAASAAAASAAAAGEKKEGIVDVKVAKSTS